MKKKKNLLFVFLRSKELNTELSTMLWVVPVSKKAFTVHGYLVNIF